MCAKGAPFSLCMEVLGRLHRAGILDKIVLIGSWCTYFYRAEMGICSNIGTLRTDDIDFLIPTPFKADINVNLAELIKDLGFILRRGMNGQMLFEHADMRIDFIVLERGRGSDKPQYVKQLGIMAQPLRFDVSY